MLSYVMRYELMSFDVLSYVMILCYDIKWYMLWCDVIWYGMQRDNIVIWYNMLWYMMRDNVVI